MGSLALIALGSCPIDMSKVNIARWLKAMRPDISWDEAHYHAMQVVMKRIEDIFVDDFMRLDIPLNEDKIREIFSRSVSQNFDWITSKIELSPELCFQEILLENL